MTRSDEITQAAESEYFVTKAEEFAWIYGAEWSDEHPRKGLWDADKVCRVFKDYMLKNHFFDNRIERTAIIDNIICDLRKEMEE